MTVDLAAELVEFGPMPLAETLQELRATVEQIVAPSRERSLVLTKLDEAELWLSRCDGASS